MKPGNFVLDILKEIPKNRKTIVLIRHSKRNSFEGIPDKLREGVEITPEGIFMAREFGESLGKILTGKPLFLGHTVAHRCKMTAESIRDGYSSDSSVRILGCEPEIKSPVVNLEKFIAIRNELGWKEGIRKWLDKEIPDDTLHNPRQYSDYVLRNLVSCPAVGDRDLLIAIAHDITLFPIISSVFGEKVKAIEFLNGIVITADTNTAVIHFTDKEFSLKKEWKIL